ncbi:CIA30 family protein [Flavimaricola marinus]|uniref:Complex I intermediate-associated protein 30 (CIA30) n=1 Tax=Flavimaricola marinus TaxID=1819565 RepID=A0A238LGL3_9RHOB|nr:CIA30 family protein [Flavimaricola marinus]SMY08096.1 Complex I intermediate-associated protein 30 (CIA30) [Flavimaricola marinus]
MELSPEWEYVADTVMGGVSTGTLSHETIAGRDAVRLKGDVSLENNGGFVQAAFDLALDASAWDGFEIDVFGNDHTYEMRLRTDQLTRPWQSFRAEFDASSEWKTIRLPFASFEPHRTDAALDVARLRRVGVLAIGEAFHADVAIASVRLFAR